MTKDQIAELLDELHSAEAYTRSDAIKKIVKGKIDDERLIHALNKLIENDPNQAVRNFARTALDVFGVEHSDVEPDAYVGRRMEEIGVEIQSGLDPDYKKVEDQNDFWRGVGLFLIINLILWLFGSYILNSNFMFPGESDFFGTRGSVYFRHFVSLLCLTAVINVGVMAYLNKKRPKMVPGMLAPVIVAVVIYAVVTIAAILLNADTAFK